jgi:hypothetical protein
MSRLMQCATCLVLVTLLSGCEAEPSSPPDQRVVAIGDLHADIGAARAAFQLAGATDKNDQWIGGDLIVVQLGDLIGRSYEEREVLDFVLTVKESAAAAGGHVYLLVGNHEVFGAEMELRWVEDEAYAAYEDIEGLDVEAPRVAELPAEKRARVAALSPGGTYGANFSEFPAVLQLGDTVFAHGGVTPIWAEYGIDRINDEIGRWFAGEIEQPAPALGRDPRLLDDNVMMSRHFSQDVGEEECALLDESLKILGAKRMIVAHTVQDTITSYCNEKVWAIDVGMSRYYGGNIEVLELVDDEVTKILH